MSSTIAIIPARSGSKRVRDKNIRALLGKPLLAYSIEQAKASRSIERVIVSTDSPEYADIAWDYGAKIPFLRPKEIALDDSTDLQVFQHALRWLEENEKDVPEIVVHLRPTYPMRRVADIDAMIELVRAHPEIDSARSIAPAPFTPFKMWFRDEEGLLAPVVTCDIPEAYNMPQQELPAAYAQNACIDVVRARVILEKNSMTGSRIFGYVMAHNIDIDTEEDFQRAELEMLRANPALVRGKTFCIDIDGVIAALTPNNEYTNAKPQTEFVRAVNQLYHAGCRILLFTARGYVTKRDWSETTRAQLEAWGVRYHELHFGKPAADFYVDDRMLALADLIPLADALQDQES